MAIQGVKLAVGTGGNISRGTTITKGAFSLTFDRPVIFRETADGLHLVHANGASVTAYAPAQTTIDGASVNGFSPNTAMNFSLTAGSQGQDGRMNGAIIAGTNYGASKRKALPWKPIPSDSVILQNASSLLTGVALPHRAGLAAGWHGVQFVNSLPATAPARLISNCFAAWPSKSATTPASFDIDVDALAASLPRYALTPGTYPDVQSVLDKVDKYLGLGLYSADDTSGYGYESFVPQGTTDLVGNTNKSNYGQYLGRMMSAGWLHLIGDQATIAQKRALLLRNIQIGAHIFEGSRGTGLYPGKATTPGGLGGHNQWEIPAIVIYLWARGLSADLDNLINTYGGNTLTQPFFWTSEQLAKLAPHSSTSLPMLSRKRAIGTVSGLDLTAASYYPSGDISRMNVEQCLVKRASDGAQAVVTVCTNSLLSSGPLAFTIDAHPSPAFAVGDEVYFGPRHTITAGDADWRLGWDDKILSPSSRADYRIQNLTFLAALLLFRALFPGPAWRADWDALKAYVLRSLAPNNPGPGAQDYPPATEAVAGYGMAQAFFDAHKAELGLG